MRRLRRCATLLLAAPLLAVGVAGPARAADAPRPATAAAAWLTTQFVGAAHLPAPGGDHFESKLGSSSYPNYGENADVLFGLAAAKVGAAKATVALDYLNAHLADYADTAGAFGGPFDGSIAKLALARIVAGTSAADLLTTLKSDECPAKAKKCTPGAPHGIFAGASDSFVLLAEARAGGSFAPSAAALAYFLSLQCTNGGFTTKTAACGSGAADVDATSYALMALQALGGHPAEVASAADWLASQRTAAGYWLVQGVPNTNSTGLAAAALAGAGRDVSTSRSWLLAQQVPAGAPGAGALKYAGAFTPTTTSATSPSVIATAQGILGLVDGGSLATVTAAGSSRGVTLLPPVIRTSTGHVSPGGTVHLHVTGFAAGERAVISLEKQPGHAIGTATVDPAGTFSAVVTVPATTPAGSDPLVVVGPSSGFRIEAYLVVGAAAPGSPSTPGAPPLANTGTNSSTLSLLGLGLLLAGAIALAAGRSRRSHAA